MAIKLPFLSPILSLALLYQLGSVQATTFNLMNKCDYTLWPGILSSSDFKLRILSPILSLALLYQLGSIQATTFNLVNKCDYTVWPGILSNAGIPQLSTTGFTLQPSASQSINLPSSWGGRLWGRTLCTTSSTGNFLCQTGDCGSGKIDCSGRGGSIPATLAEFTLDGSGGDDFYDVSLVDGFNLPMNVVPSASGTGVNCSATGCAADLNGECPTGLRVMDENGSKSVACKSACDAFNQAQYCCSGEFGGPDTCKPSEYSEVFKKACPRAYSYAYDDKTSTFVCAGSPDYTITFCPLPGTSKKASNGQLSPASPSTQSPNSDSSMVYEGAMDFSSTQSWRLSIGYLLWAALLTCLILWAC